MLQAGVPGAGIVDRELHRWTKSLNGAAHRLVIGDRHSLGDLEDEVASAVLDEVMQARAGRDELGRHVQAQPARRRQLGSGLERRLKACELELHAEADRTRPGEDDVGWLFVEARERLVARDVPRFHLDDGLEDR